MISINYFLNINLHIFLSLPLKYRFIDKEKVVALPLGQILLEIYYRFQITEFMLFRLQIPVFTIVQYFFLRLVISDFTDLSDFKLFRLQISNILDYRYHILRLQISNILDYRYHILILEISSISVYRLKTSQITDLNFVNHRFCIPRS